MPSRCVQVGAGHGRKLHRITRHAQELVSRSLGLSVSRSLGSLIVAAAIFAGSGNPVHAQELTPEELAALEMVEAPPAPIPPFVPVTTVRLLTPAEFFAINPDYRRRVSEKFTHDHDGDGIQDFSIEMIGLGGVGSLIVYSGWTGHELFTITGVEPNDMFGYTSLGIRDVSGDQRPDFLTGAPASSLVAAGAGAAYMHSGANGETLTVIRGSAEGGAFGYAVTDVGDLDGDGLAEIAVSAPWEGPGRVYLFLSSTLRDEDGNLFGVRTTADASLTITGEAEGDLFGFSIASAGDIDGDGYDDLIVGAPGHDAGAANNISLGKVYLYSGFDGSLLGSITGGSAGDALGSSVSAAGDIDSDGLADIMIGAPSGDPGAADRGRAYVFYSASLSAEGWPFTPRLSADADLTLSAGQAEPEADTDVMFGFVTALGNDVNEDGRRDLIVRAGIRSVLGRFESTRGYVFSGADGAFLYSFVLGDAADEPDPPCCGGDDDTEPIGPIDPDGLINTIINNMGMEGATLAHGDLDGTSVVTTDDLILAIEWIATGELPGGAAAATAQNEEPAPGGDTACLEAGGVDENGEPMMRPREDPDDTTGGGGNNNNDPNGGYPAGGRCANYYQIGWIPVNGEPALSWEQCFMRGICALADAKDKGKADAKAARDEATSQTRDKLDKATANAQATRDGSGDIARNTLLAKLALTTLKHGALLVVEVEATGAASATPAAPIARVVGGTAIAVTVINGAAEVVSTAIDYKGAIAQADWTMATDPFVGAAKDAHNEQIAQSNNTLSQKCAELENNFDESRRELCRSCDRDFERLASVPISYCR